MMGKTKNQGNSDVLELAAAESALWPRVPINVRIINEKAVLPEYATAGASGFDFKALKSVHVYPLETAVFKTGLIFEIPPGLEMQIRPRGGLSKNTPLRIANSPGTVDSDYRGEVCILVNNIGDWPVLISEGDRIAQGVICPVYKAVFNITEHLSATVRGSGKFASTGK